MSALQISANREWADVGLLHIRNGGIEIELRDVTENQAPGVRALCDAAHDVG